MLTGGDSGVGRGSATGKADWGTFFCCGKNLFGRSERYEHWERLVLQRLNDANAPPPDDPNAPPVPTHQRTAGGSKVPTWKIVKHCVLAEMRLTVYERNRSLAQPPTPAAPTPGKKSPALRFANRGSQGWDVIRRVSGIGGSLTDLFASQNTERKGVTAAHRDRVALGKGGIVANKGGLAIELHVDGTPLLIVATHLAAHDHAINKRNKQAGVILGELSRRCKLGIGRENSEAMSRRWTYSPSLIIAYGLVISTIASILELASYSSRRLLHSARRWLRRRARKVSRLTRALTVATIRRALITLTRTA